MTILSGVSNSVTNHMLIEYLGSLVSFNSTWIEIIFTPQDDQWNKYIVEVYANKTKKETFVSLKGEYVKYT